MPQVLYNGNHKPAENNRVPVRYFNKYKTGSCLILDGKDMQTTSDLRKAIPGVEIVVVECNSDTFTEQQKKTKRMVKISVIQDTIGHYIITKDIPNKILLDYCASYYGNATLGIFPWYDLIQTFLKLKFSDFMKGVVILSVCRRSGKKGFTDARLIKDIESNIYSISDILKMTINMPETNRYTSNNGRRYGSPMLQCVLEFNKKGETKLTKDEVNHNINILIQELKAAYNWIVSNFIYLIIMWSISLK